MYFLEGRSVFGVSPPAAEHDSVQSVGTQDWLRQIDLPFLVPEELARVLDHLFVGEL